MKTVIALALFASILALPCAAQAPVKPARVADGASRTLCVTSENDCEKMLVEGIASAKRQLLVHVDRIASPGIQRALADAAQRGVEMRILVGQEAWADDHTFYKDLMSRQVSLRTEAKGNLRSGFMLVDGYHVATGGFSFAPQAGNSHDVVLVISGDTALNQEFAQKFLARWLESVEFR